MGLAEGGTPRARGVVAHQSQGEHVLPQNCYEPVLEGRGVSCLSLPDVSEEEECSVTLWARGRGPRGDLWAAGESGTTDSGTTQSSLWAS